MLAGEGWVPSQVVVINYVEDRLREWAIKKVGANIQAVFPPRKNGV